MLNYDIKFITCDEALHLKQGELKVYKYETKKRVEETVYESGKRNYCERRGGHWRASQPRQIRRLEAKLKDRSVIACDWTSESLITIVFTSGVIAYLTVKPDTLDISQVLFDKYCLGKLAGQSVTAVVLSNTHLLFIHVDRIATLITFGKKDVNLPCRITDRDPHIQMLELGGPSRRGERKVSWRDNVGTIRVLIWGASVEPAPWSPAIEDRANLHLYQITGQQVTLAAYHQLENETLLVELSSSNDNTIHIVEQSICHKNGVNLEWIRYSMEVSDIGDPGRAVCLTGARSGSTRVQLPAPARVLTRPADNDSRLLAACIDGSLLLIHRDSGLTHSTKAGFIATDVMWAGDLVVAFEESGRLQCFDRALSLLHQHSKCLDLTTYLHESRRMQLLATRTVRGGQLVLALFAGGPLTLLKIKHPLLLTAWVRWGRVSNAVRLLRAMDWESEGAQCLWAVNALVVGALRRPLRPPVAGGGEGSEAAAQAALGAFLAPQSPLPPGAHKYAPPVHDLARKFFHHLLRRGRMEKALSLGVDLRAWDLFCDARCAALRERRPSLAAEAAALAQHYAHHLPNQNTFTESECSGTCSQCSSRSYSDSEEETSVNSEPLRTKPPPLPRVPLQPSLLPVPLSHPEPASTNSIRPNLHQYLDRDNTIWNTELKQHNESGLPPSVKWHSVENVLGAKGSLKYSSLVSINDNRSLVDVIPKPQNDRVTASHFKNLFQTELREESADTLYRYNYNVGDRTYKCNMERNRPAEKNKVKFSDTVTIAVVSETPPGVPQPLRELAESLPLCPPHKYLAAFAPLPPASAPPPAEHAAPKPPPKIKVVHFGMV